MDLSGKVALVTGGGSGIGAGIARRLAKDGAKVVIAGRRENMLRKIADSAPEGSMKICPSDVTVPADVEKMVQTTVDFGGTINVLVNDAGIDNPGNVVDIELELWNKVIATNLTGPMLTIKHTVPHMIKGGGGSIINISSLAGVVCIPNMPAYCASKAGLNHFTKQVAYDYGKYNIRCNVVCPGATKSFLENPPEPLTEEAEKGMSAWFDSATKFAPIPRAGHTSDVSSLVSFLASDESTIMTGAQIMVDSGTSVVDVNAVALSNTGANWGEGEDKSI